MEKMYTENDIVRLWARQCDITKEGMDKGWIWGDGAFYTKYLVDTLFECRRDRDNILLDVDDFDASNVQDPDRWDEYKEAVERSKINRETDMNLLTIAYQTDYVYYTEWEQADYLYAEMSDGNVVELREVDSGYD